MRSKWLSRPKRPDAIKAPTIYQRAQKLRTGPEGNRIAKIENDDVPRSDIVERPVTTGVEWIQQYVTGTSAVSRGSTRNRGHCVRVGIEDLALESAGNLLPQGDGH